MKHKLNAAIARVKAALRAHKKLSIAALIISVLGLTAVGLTVFGVTDSSEVSRTNPDVALADEAEDTSEVLTTSPLTGLSVPENLATRPVTAVIIENSPDARPQSSLHEAGMIFESIAEGGITRYVALYQETSPDIIGPVRSLRPYFTDWVLTFDASIAHVGGSSAALKEAEALGLKDLDEFKYSDTYYRTTDRFAPHNAYTSFERIDPLNEQLGYTSSTFDAISRKPQKPLAKPTATNIDVNISSFTYLSQFSYDKAQNRYLHTIGGEANKDKETDTRIAPKVVVVIETDFTIADDGRYNYDLVGSGKATVFQDGGVIVGNWVKEGRDEQFRFETDGGNTIRLNPGQVWVSAISPSQEVEYTP